MLNDVAMLYDGCGTAALSTFSIPGTTEILKTQKWQGSTLQRADN